MALIEVSAAPGNGSAIVGFGVDAIDADGLVNVGIPLAPIASSKYLTTPQAMSSHLSRFLRHGGGILGRQKSFLQIVL
ncbi:MAG: hypothetical protein GY930_07500 [bacterium]|nr:hypothetical protein [bacterium]